MDLNQLTAISPVDGRYRSQLAHLSAYFSEYALIRYRIRVEVEYFIALSAKKLFPCKPAQAKALRELYEHFPLEKAQEIKNVERITNHDVKAVEYYIKKELDALRMGAYREFVHFGLTSQDINNTAIPLLWKEALEHEYYPTLSNLILRLKKTAKQWMDIPMLARTHGQPASPTRLGKEIMVFAERLEQQVSLMQVIPYSCKFGGATGNFNAHAVAYPKINWIEFANTFCADKLGLQRQQQGPLE